MKKMTVVLMVLTIIFSITGCGSKKEVAVESTVVETTKPRDTEAKIDPDDIRWGYEDYSGSDNNDTQHWYVDGDKTSTSYIFMDDNYLTKVEGEKREQFRTAFVDKHLVDLDTKGEGFAYVFPDVFTCYDTINKVWYLRCDYDAVVKSLSSTTFVHETENDCKYTFKADGTLIYEDNGESRTGTWLMEDANQIHEHLDGGGETGLVFEIKYADDSWDVKSISNNDNYYPEK